MASINTKSLLETIPGLSLRRIAAELHLNYNMLLKWGKRPIEGAVYDPAVLNYDAVDAYITARTQEDIVSQIAWDELASSNTTTVAELLTIGNFPVGMVLTLRGDETPYELVLKTATHVVLNPLVGTQPRVLNAATFLHQGPKVALQDEAPAENLEDAAAQTFAAAAPEAEAEATEAAPEAPKKTRKSKVPGIEVIVEE